MNKISLLSVVIVIIFDSRDVVRSSTVELLNQLEDANQRPVRNLVDWYNMAGLCGGYTCLVFQLLAFQFRFHVACRVPCELYCMRVVAAG